MGERAIAVIEDGDTLYCYRTQWGGTTAVLDALFSVTQPSVSFDVILEHEWRFLGSCHREHLCEYIASRPIAALYFVHSGGIEVYCPLRFELGLTEQSEKGVSVVYLQVPSVELFRQCRQSVREFKGVILDFVRDNTLTPAQAARISESASALVSSTGCSISLCSKHL